MTRTRVKKPLEDPPIGAFTRLTPHVHDTIVKFLKSGNYLEVAAGCAGVSFTAVRQWIATGNKEIALREDGKKPRPELDHYVVFAKDVISAETEAEARATMQIVKAGETNWNAAAFYLERKFPKRWSPQVHVHVTQELEGFLNALERKLPADLFERVLRAADEAAREGEAR